MSASIFIPPMVQFYDGQGQPLVGGKIYTYENLTTTPKYTYKTWTAGISDRNTNPVILDAAGRAAIWLTGTYSIAVEDVLGNPIYSADNVFSYTSFDLSGLTASVADLNSTTTSAIIIHTDYTVQIVDRCRNVLCNCASNNIDVTLPNISLLPNTWKITIKKIDFSTNKVTLRTSAGQTVDGITNYVLYEYGDCIEVLADGSQWRIVSSYLRGNLVSKSANFSVDLSYQNKTVFCDTTSQNIVVTLPGSTDVGNGFTVQFKSGPLATSNVTTINPSSPDTIDGASSLTLYEGYQSVMLKLWSGPPGVASRWYIVESSLIGAPMVGDMKTSWNKTQAGWLLTANDSWEIGSALSSAHYNNNACHDLFVMLYNTWDNSICPVSGGRSGNAENDWNAGKRLKLPSMCSCVLGIAGTSDRSLTPRGDAVFVGEENHTITLDQSANHGHGGPAEPSANGFSSGQGFYVKHWQDPPPGAKGEYVGGGQAHNNMQPTVFIPGYIKL